MVGVVARWRKFPKWHKVSPTLRGLQVKAPSASEGVPSFFPWSQVSRLNKSWCAASPEGELLRDARGRQIRFALEDPYKEAIAAHAYRRWVRMAVRDHSLVMKEKIPGTRGVGFFLLGDGLLMGFLFRESFGKMLRFLSGEGQEYFPPHYRWLISALAVMQLFIFGGMITTALIGGLWLAICPQVRRIEISGDQLTAVMTNGDTRSYSFRDLTSVSPLGTVTFNRVNKLRFFMPPRRVIIAFQAAAQAYLPRIERPLEVKKKRRASALRIVGFSLLAAIGGYFVVDFFAIPAEDSDGKGMGPIGAALVIFLVGVLHAVVVSSIPAASIRRYHRFTMKRRRLRRAAASSS